MKYVVFITMCKQSNLYFIGLHEQENEMGVFDGYLGDGVWAQKASTFKYPKSPFQFAVKKYGSDKFVRVDLGLYDNYQDAYNHYLNLFTNGNKDLTYNVETIPSKSQIFQFNLDGKLVKEWNCIQDIIDFYGYPYEKINQSIICRNSLCNSFWAYESEINIYKYDTRPIHYIYMYDLKGVCQKIFGTIDQVSELLDVPIKELLEHINKQTLIKNYYVSYKLLDVYKPKVRRQLKDEKYYVYDLQGKLIKECIGKEVMNVIRCHSWKKIGIILRNSGWYHEYFISNTPVDKLPPHKQQIIDVYDKYGNFIESTSDISLLKMKYSLTNANIKNIQLGEQFFNDYIFKYNK